MRRAVRPSLSDEQRRTLERWSRGGSTPYRLVIRSQIVLLAALGYSNRRIGRLLRTNPITVARWRSRFLLLGLEGIRHEAPRLGSPPPLPQELVRAILDKTLFERPPSGPRWTTRSLARTVGVSHSTVRRVWRAHGVRPPSSRVAGLALAARPPVAATDVVGVYVNPPQRAVAIAIRDHETPRGENATAGHGPGSSTPGRSGRSWVADLATTLHLLEGTGPKGSAQRLVDQEFLSFLHSVEERRRGRERIQLLAESSATAPSVPLTRWLHRHPEFSAQVRSGGTSLRQVVVDWFGTNPALPPADTPAASLPDLRSAVEHWTRESSEGLRPFAWTRK